MTSALATTSTLPPTVEALFRPLHKELIDIHQRWSLYRQLFGTSPERVHLLNRFMPVLSFYLQTIQYDDLILCLFRFTDPAATGGKANLTLDRLAAAVTADDPAFGASVEAASTAIRALLAPHADWRNKRVAHNDLATKQALWGSSSTMSGPSRRQVEEVLERMRRLMNAVGAHYGESPTLYEVMMMRSPGDADTLVRHLEDLAQRRDAERAERMALRATGTAGLGGK